MLVSGQPTLTQQGQNNQQRLSSVMAASSNGTIDACRFNPHLWVRAEQSSEVKQGRGSVRQLDVRLMLGEHSLGQLD